MAQAKPRDDGVVYLPPSAVIESVVITWCNGAKSKRRSAEVDVGKVGGIIWRPVTNQRLDPAATPGKMPHKNLKELGSCHHPLDEGAINPAQELQPVAKAMRMGPPPEFCWWDGSQWVCPSDPCEDG